MRKIVIWGTGVMAQKYIELANKGEDPVEIVAVVDNCVDRQGTVWNGYTVQNPHKINNLNFDKIITSALYYIEICSQLENEFGYGKNFALKGSIHFIDTFYCLQREAFLRYYEDEHDAEKLLCVEYVRKNPIGIFNYDFTSKYRISDINVNFDDTNGLYYVYYKSKKMYFSRNFDSILKVQCYMKQILMEQDEESPHRYLNNEFNVKKDSVVLDVGVAEGNFALEIIDQVKKIYLIEMDELWIEALEYTFAPYLEKVNIIHKSASNNNEGTNITIDAIVKNQTVDFIKMDIEGTEILALEGGVNALLNNNIKLAVCTYHHANDYRALENLISPLGYECSSSSGYMVFLHSENFFEVTQPKLVRGILRAEKKKQKLLYIWGAGRQLENVYSAINMSEVVVKGIIDSNAKLDGKKWDNKEVIYTPEILNIENFDYILISAINDKDIYDQCIELGISPKKISSFWNDDKLIGLINYDVRKMLQLNNCVQKYKLRLENYPFEIAEKKIKLKFPIIKSANELIDKILSSGCSLCRFGDGEFELIRMKERAWFQHVDIILANRLMEVLHSNKKEIIVAVADNFGDLSKYTEEAADTIRQYLAGDTRHDVVELLGTDKIYYDAYVSRPYLIYKDKENAINRFKRIKLLWQNRNVLIVEGQYSKMGWKNDLLDNVLTLRRILCPPQDAFQKYSKILDTVLELADRGDLVIVSLGPTATILAYDLALSGIQALDIGQLDNEYDWFLRKAARPIRIEGKMTAEYSKHGWIPKELDGEEFNCQVAARIK